jgi:hypothetical protein
MLNVENYKEKFKDHVATVTDYGNIKVLDFKKPDSIYYQIRFLFEENCYKLHISGDLGDLTATNECNMTLEKFSDFINNPEYFIEKIDCCSRDIYYYNEKLAIEQMKDFIKKYDLEEELLDSYYGSNIEEIIQEIFSDFDDETGIGIKGCNIIEEVLPEYYLMREVRNMGKTSTGIIELYLLAFKLAMEQLENN